MMRSFVLTLFVVVLLAAGFAGSRVWAKHHDHRDAQGASAPGLANNSLLVVRHAEKPNGEGDLGLAPAGEARAKAYATYFQHFTVDGVPVLIDTLIASADSKESARPRLTLEPLSKAVGLPIQRPFANKQVNEAARWIRSGDAHIHGAALIAWHPGKLAKLLDALGADPATLLPDGIWPNDVYDWIIVLRYDAAGRLSTVKRIREPAELSQGAS